MTSHHHATIKGYTAHANIKPRKPSAMISLNADGFSSYKSACQAIDALCVAGIESGLTTGGIWLLIDPGTQGTLAKGIVESHGGELCAETLTQGLSMQDYSTAHMDALAARHNVIAATSALGDTTS